MAWLWDGVCTAPLPTAMKWMDQGLADLVVPEGARTRGAAGGPDAEGEPGRGLGKRSRSLKEENSEHTRKEMV